MNDAVRVDAVPVSTAPETRARLLALHTALPDPNQRRMLQIWLDHWWAEVVYDIDTVCATLSEDVAYRSYGAVTFGGDIRIDGIDAAAAMYRALFARGLMPGGPFDQERISFGDWGLHMDAVFTSVFPGDMLPGLALRPDPDALYLIRWHMAVAHPMDLRRSVMRAEIMYPGAPFLVEPAGRDTIEHLLGR